MKKFLKKKINYFFAKSLNYCSRKVQYKINIEIEPNVVANLRKKFMVSGRFKCNKSLVEYLSVITNITFSDGYKTGLDLKEFRIHNFKNLELDNEVYGKSSELVIKYIKTDSK